MSRIDLVDRNADEARAAPGDSRSQWGRSITVRPSIDTIAAMFGVSPERVRTQYRTNLQGLQDDLAKVSNGRKVRGMDSRKIRECINTINSQIGA